MTLFHVISVTNICQMLCSTSIETESFDKGVLLRSPPPFVTSWLCSFPHYFSMAPHPENCVRIWSPLPPFLSGGFGATLGRPACVSWPHLKPQKRLNIYFICPRLCKQSTGDGRRLDSFFFPVVNFCLQLSSVTTSQLFGAPTELTYVYAS